MAAAAMLNIIVMVWPAILFSMWIVVNICVKELEFESYFMNWIE